MQPFIKWPGGKERELKHIEPALPDNYENFFDPFVGGGSVFAAFEAEHYFINDLSTELMAFYRAIADRDPQFFAWAEAIDEAWNEADRFFEFSPELIDIYMRYRRQIITRQELIDAVNAFCRRNRPRVEAVVGGNEIFNPPALCIELGSNLCRKMLRMRELEIRNSDLSPDDVSRNIRTAVKSALYMLMRSLYNGEVVNRQFHTALFMFVRNYCFSSMFRYSADGKFNVPYGGMAYNSKRLVPKLEYYMSDAVAARMETTTVENLDFLDFFEIHNPGADDFVFIDPPYDSVFNTYDRNSFSHADHLRLANYLVNYCAARWMLVIKNTDFIFQLYDHPHINIRAFDKAYQVSFMNRNERDVEHLLITNY